MEPNSLSTCRLQDQIFFCELPFSLSLYAFACLHGEETSHNLHVSKQTFLWISSILIFKTCSGGREADFFQVED